MSNGWISDYPLPVARCRPRRCPDMDAQSTLLAQAPLHGGHCRDVPVDGDDNGGCLELRQLDELGVTGVPDRLVLPAGRARNWMLALSTVTVVSAALAVVSK